MAEWSFLTNHARALLYISRTPRRGCETLPSARRHRTHCLRIVADLTAAGYVVKEKDGRRNRYHIQDHLPLRDSISRERTIGEVLTCSVMPDVAARSGRAADRTEASAR